MEHYTSTTRLLDCDELDLNTNQTEDYYSSGYDSATESSETDSGTEAGEQHDVKDGVSQVKRYRSTHNLCDDLKYILSMPELCDVTFLVGEKKIPVYGLKAILATRSRIFHSLILKIQRQKAEEVYRQDRNKSQKQTTLYPFHIVIEVNKYKPEDFRRIIQFVHCGMVDINSGNVVGLYCGASQFDLPDLKTACCDYIQHTLKNSARTTSKLHAEIQKYNHHKSSQRLWSKIEKFAQNIENNKNSHSRRKETVL